MRPPSRRTWDDAWAERRDPSLLYSNDDRLGSQVVRAGSVDGKLVVEVGAGTGRDSRPLAARGARVVQLDYAPSALEILGGRSRGESDIHVVGGDAFALPFADGRVDVVMHQGLLEHFHPPEAEALLRENRRVLRDGGLLVVDVPQRYHPFTLGKHLLIARGTWFAGWERSFSAGELAETIRRAGFSILWAYGDWSRPSFAYRAFRHALGSEHPLPLHPPSTPLTPLRRRLGESLRRTRLPLYTGISIGVVARR